MNSKSLLIIVISLRITRLSRKKMAIKEGIIWNFPFMTTTVIRPVLNLKKPRSYCSPRNSYFFVPSDDELAQWSDKTVHKAKPTDIREQLGEIINWTRFWLVIFTFYERNMFTSKMDISEENEALMFNTVKVIWRRVRFTTDFKLTEGFTVLFCWKGK